MKLERLRQFVQELDRDNLVTRFTASRTVYYYFDGHWYDISGPIDAAAIRIADLERTRRTKEHWRHKGDSKRYFYIADLDAVVVGLFAKAPAEATRAIFQDAINNCSRHALNAFNAAYDGLTELLNRDSFNKILSEALSHSVPATPPQSAIVAAGRQVALFSIDLDHFKQLNDNHGHPYGDIVLKSFARRLEEITSDQANNFAGRCSFDVTRPGGEEFSIIEEGNLSDDEVCRIAKALCSEIGVLPSAAQWTALTSRGFADGITLPPDGERTVTCSIGVATVATPVHESQLKVAKADLINKADLALYKAKANGRNTYCFFPDILKRYGRVLEYHVDTQHVVIDLGSEVGLRRGQELLVYHPDFSGSKDFIYRDGRTAKKIGTYPRVVCARLIAYDVQKEISFCTIADRNPNTANIVERSSLEAVPLGAIGHLVGTAAPWEGTGGVRLASVDQLRSEISGLIESEEDPIAVVFSLKNSKVLIESVGAASVNRALANLYQVIKDTFPPNTIIAATSPTEYAIALPRSHFQTKNKDILLDKNPIADSLAKANGASGGRVRFVVGVYDPVALRISLSNHYGDKSLPKNEYALELARYIAQSDVGNVEPEIRTCSIDWLLYFLEQSITERKPREAIEDYKKLREYGFSNGQMEDATLRAAYAIGDYELAREAGERAIGLAPETLGFHANYAVLLFLQTQYQEAYAQFVISRSDPERYEFPDAYLGAFALAAYESVVVRGDQNLTKPQVLDLLRNALANKDSTAFVDVEALLKAAKSLAE